MSARVSSPVFLCLLLSLWFGGVRTGAAATVLTGDQALDLEVSAIEGSDLWITPSDLTRINGFVLKPEGACRDEICIPLRAAAGQEGLTREREGRTLINLSGFLRKIGQVHAFDAEAGVWSLGPLPMTMTGGLKSGMAPDFTLPNVEGEDVSLSEFRGKKVLIVTWASW